VSLNSGQYAYYQVYVGSSTTLISDLMTLEGTCYLFASRTPWASMSEWTWGNTIAGPHSYLNLDVNSINLINSYIYFSVYGEGANNNNCQLRYKHY